MDPSLPSSTSIWTSSPANWLRCWVRPVAAKTTTLRMISGLDSPTSGEIFFDGRDVSDVPVRDRNVGMVFQRYALFPHMSVEKNITFGLSESAIFRQRKSASGWKKSWTSCS